MCGYWVDDNYEIYEDPIGLIQVPKTDANTLTDTLKDVLVRCILPRVNAGVKPMMVHQQCQAVYMELLHKSRMNNQLHFMCIVLHIV